MRIQLRDLAPGTDYLVQARAINGVPGHESEWSHLVPITTDQDLTPPKAVGSLDLVVVGTSFVATWNRPVENDDGSELLDLSHYVVTITGGGISKVYNTTAERFDIPFEVNRGAFGTPQATVSISVVAVDLAGNQSDPATDTATNPAPAAITGLQGYPQGDGIVFLWTPSAETDLLRYDIYRSTSTTAANAVKVGSSSDPTFTYATDDFNTPGYFWVYPVDVFGTPATTSPRVGPLGPKNYISPDNTAPNPPTAANVTTALDTTDANSGTAVITLSWTASTSTDVVGYRVRYATSATGPWTYMDLPGDAVTAIVRGLSPNTAYYTSVQAYDHVGLRSAWATPGTAAPSYPITTSRDTTGPAQVTGVVVSGGMSSVTVTWNAATESDTANGRGNYEVQLDTVNTFNSGALKTLTAGGTIISFTGLAQNTVYYARVRAKDANGNWGTYSATASGNTGTVVTNTTQIEADIISARNAADAAKAAADAAQAAAVNVIRDPSFELTANGQTVPGWEVAADLPRTGAKALRAPATGTAGSYHHLATNIPVLPGQTWRARAWVRRGTGYNGTDNNGKLRLGHGDGTSVVMGTYINAVGFSSGAADTYILREMEYVVPATGVTHLILTVGRDHTAGTLHVDDVELTNISDLKAALASAKTAQDAADAVAVRATNLEGRATTTEGNITTINTNIQGINTQVDKKATIWVQGTNPGVLTAADNEDLWINTADNRKMYRYSHGAANSGWLEVSDERISQALQGLTTKVSTYTGTALPTTGTFVDGDLYILQPDNRIHRRQGTTWVPLNLGATAIDLVIGGLNLLSTSTTLGGSFLASGLTKGTEVAPGPYTDSAAAVKNENVIFIERSSTATNGVLRIRDLKRIGWHTFHVWYKRRGTVDMPFALDINDVGSTGFTATATWQKAVITVNVTQITSTYNFVDIELTAVGGVQFFEPMLEAGQKPSSYVISDLERATAITTAQNTANGKNSVTYSTLAAASTTPGIRAGDIWWQYETVSGQRRIIGQWEWSGTAWVSQVLTNSVIATLDAAKITSGTLDAGRIGAGTIDVGKLNVIVGGGNLLSNSGFESSAGLTSWSLLSPAPAPGPNAAISQITSDRRSGSSACRLEVLVTTNVTDQTHNYSINQTASAFDNGPMVVSIWAKAPVGRRVSVRATRRVDGADQWGGGASADASASDVGTGTWKRYFVTLTEWTGAGTTTAVLTRFAIVNGTSAVVVGDVVLFDDAQAESGNMPTAYSPKTTELLPGTIAAVHMQANTIKADSGIIESLNAEIVKFGTMSGDRITSGSLHGAKVTAGTLDADRIAANSAFSRNVGIAASLVMGYTPTYDANGAVTNPIVPTVANIPEIRSGNYTAAGTTGYRLTDTTLDIKAGTIAARALQIQSSPNIANSNYASFGGAVIPITRSSTVTGSGTLIDTTRFKFGSQSMKLTPTTTADASTIFTLANAVGDYNTPFEAGKTYIVSIWVYPETAGTITLGTRMQTAASDSTAVTAGSWQRIKTVQTASLDNGNVYITLPSGLVVNIDGLMVEEKMAGLETPSAWSPPGVTTIDGGIIRTGEIVSSATATEGESGPAWALKMTGEATLRDAHVRGRIIVGNSSQTALQQQNTAVRSWNYQAGSAGWAIAGNGNVEFNNATLRGHVEAASGDIGGFVISNTGTAAAPVMVLRTSVGTNTETGLSGTIPGVSTATPAAFWAGGARMSAPFRVLHSGSMWVQQATFGGTTDTTTGANSGGFTVNTTRFNNSAQTIELNQTGYIAAWQNGSFSGAHVVMDGRSTSTNLFYVNNGSTNTVAVTRAGAVTLSQANVYAQNGNVRIAMGPAATYSGGAPGIVWNKMAGTTWVTDPLISVSSTETVGAGMVLLSPGPVTGGHVKLDLIGSGTAGGGMLRFYVGSNQRFSISNTQTWVGGGLEVTGTATTAGLTNTGGTSLQGGYVDVHGGLHKFNWGPTTRMVWHANSADSNAWGYAGIEVRKDNYSGPSIAFHQGNVVASTLGIEADGALTARGDPGTWYQKFKASQFQVMSDISTKRDIVELETGMLSKVRKVKAKRFSPKEATQGQQRFVGFVAQDLDAEGLAVPMGYTTADADPADLLKENVDIITEEVDGVMVEKKVPKGDVPSTLGSRAISPTAVGYDLSELIAVLWQALGEAEDDKDVLKAQIAADRQELRAVKEEMRREVAALKNVKQDKAGIVPPLT